MAEKRKAKVRASDVEVGNRTLDAVLADFGEHMKDASARATRALEEIEKLRGETRLALDRTAAMLEHLGALTRDHIGLAARVDAIEKAP